MILLHKTRLNLEKGVVSFCQKLHWVSRNQNGKFALFLCAARVIFAANLRFCELDDITGSCGNWPRYTCFLPQRTCPNKEVARFVAGYVFNAFHTIYKKQTAGEEAIERQKKE